MLSIPNLEQLRAENPYTYEAVKRLLAAVNALTPRAGVDTAGAVAAPPPIGALSVAAANGIADIAITDPAGAGSKNRPLFYFVEFAADPAFSSSVTVGFGPARNYRWAIGNLSGYFRARSQFLDSPLSSPLSFGNPPILVIGGGSGPALQPSQGSGIGSGGGFGA